MCGMINAVMSNKPLALIILTAILLSACTLLTSAPTGIGSEGVTSQPDIIFVTPLGLTTATLVASQPTLTPRPTRTPRPSPVPLTSFTRIDPRSIPDNINPLTGLPVADPSLLDRRPIVVKIPNYPHYVRPQAGISLADQIYEYYLEWGLTRFLAIFYGNDAERF